LPAFLVIVLAWYLALLLHYRADFFSTAERLVYFVLFHALFFGSIIRAPLDLGDASTLMAATALLLVSGVAMAWLAVPVLRPRPIVQASLAQCAYRFNTYMGLSDRKSVV